MEEREHLKAPSGLGQSVAAHDRGKPLRGKSARLHKMKPKQETKKVCHRFANLVVDGVVLLNQH